ncbi:DUF4435 domain-containing protein [Microcoleus sp. LEGE 07076]|uniref:DUF4435 domain-containing protein n=1 Tax=Microcoleus sp. LEGE 07076 TaxID=915322 RepID=UPI001882CF34|nr:DUF4435 domain-containing protein [Microcoleus sp. LEGE 07076]MBE9183872.1 DUF4435 domain-containing protein [Microcoleus sp. LEGE 07076]
MSYIEKLRKSREKSQVAYAEFALHTKKGKDGLFCFFEGNDNAYYVPRIKRFTDNYYPINCGGRDKVLEVYRLITIHAEYDKYKKAFFIDRDFNEPLPPHNPPIFETPCYSIENFYASVDVFKEILKNELHLSEVSDEAFQVCISLFTQRQQEFHQATSLINAWYACLIEIRNQTGNQTGVNLVDKLPKDFIHFTLDSVVQKYDCETIKHKFPQALEVSEDILNIKLDDFTRCEQYKTFRGKYEMEFVVTMIQLILQDSSNSKNYIKDKIKFTFGEKLSNEQAISLFSVYAETPESLNNYLALLHSKDS